MLAALKFLVGPCQHVYNYAYVTSIKTKHRVPGLPMILATFSKRCDLKIKQATFLSTRTAAGSKLRRYRWRMMASAVLV